MPRHKTFISRTGRTKGIGFSRRISRMGASKGMFIGHGKTGRRGGAYRKRSR